MDLGSRSLRGRLELSRGRLWRDRRRCLDSCGLLDGVWSLDQARQLERLLGRRNRWPGRGGFHRGLNTGRAGRGGIERDELRVNHGLDPRNQASGRRQDRADQHHMQRAGQHEGRSARQSPRRVSHDTSDTAMENLRRPERERSGTARVRWTARRRGAGGRGRRRVRREASATPSNRTRDTAQRLDARSPRPRVARRSRRRGGWTPMPPSTATRRARPRGGGPSEGRPRTRERPARARRSPRRKSAAIVLRRARGATPRTPQPLREASTRAHPT